MSKTTPEEAKALALKYGIHQIAACHVTEEGFNERLASLIDEVRGVDAEPVAWMMQWPNHSPSLTTDPTDYLQNERKFLIPLYTHPAPSQPAAPVGFGRTYGGCPHCGSSKCVAMQCCMPDGEPGVIRLADQVQRDTDRRLQLFYSIVSAGEAEKSAPVELPVVAWLKGDASSGDVFLVKLSDAQAAIAAGRKAS